MGKELRDTHCNKSIKEYINQNTTKKNITSALSLDILVASPLLSAFKVSANP